MSDRQLRAAARAYATYPTDANAHRLAQLTLRSMGLAEQRNEAPRITPAGPNQAEAYFPGSGAVALYSYDTLVAIWDPEGFRADGPVLWVVERGARLPNGRQIMSHTTSRHLSNFVLTHGAVNYPIIELPHPQLVDALEEA